jgi:hypothetical protein
VRAQAPALFLGALLVVIEAAGVGVEVRKTGLVVLPLLLLRAPPATRGHLACGVAAVALAVTAVDLPTRPDLRAAAAMVPQGRVPVLSVFASEAAWYIRTPAPLPSFRTPTEIAERIDAVLAAHAAPCLVHIALPGTFPAESALTTPSAPSRSPPWPVWTCGWWGWMGARWSGRWGGWWSETAGWLRAGSGLCSSGVVRAYVFGAPAFRAHAIHGEVSSMCRACGAGSGGPRRERSARWPVRWRWAAPREVGGRRPWCSPSPRTTRARTVSRARQSA